jgi:hypothetical protein
VVCALLFLSVDKYILTLIKSRKANKAQPYVFGTLARKPQMFFIYLCHKILTKQSFAPTRAGGMFDILGAQSSSQVQLAGAMASADVVVSLPIYPSLW